MNFKNTNLTILIIALGLVLLVHCQEEMTNGQPETVSTTEKSTTRPERFITTTSSSISIENDESDSRGEEPALRDLFASWLVMRLRRITQNSIFDTQNVSS